MRILLLFYNPILQIITLQCVGGGYKQKTPLLGETIQVTKNTMKNLLQPYVKINQPVVLMKILIAFHI